MKSEKTILSFCFCIFQMISYAQVTPYCNDDDCGALDPSWQFAGSQTVACEGETFYLRSGESVPYDNIDSYTWILTNTATLEELVNVTFSDTIPLEFLYNVSDSLACLSDRINIEVRLIVTSPECAEGESCRYTAEPLTIIFKPRARFSTEQIVCINDSVAFTDASCNAETYAWDFNNDGITDSTDPNPDYSFSPPGIYNVSLTVTNDCGSDTANKTIQVVGYPDADINLNGGGEICVPGFQTITMDANQWVTGPSGNFSWEINPGYTNMNGDWCFVDPDYNGSGEICLQDSIFTDNTIDSLFRTLQQLELYFMEPGEYTVTLNFGNVCGSTSVEETLYAYEPPSISGFANQSACDVVEICFDDLNITVGGDYTAVEWIFEGGSSSGSDQLDFGCVTFTESGIITLNVSAYDPCMDISGTMHVSVVVTPEVEIPDPVPNIICPNGGLITLEPDHPGGNYEYNGSPATFIANDMLDPSGLSPENYTVTYVLSDNPDCPAEDDFSFTIQEGPSITLGENEAVCESVSNFNPAITDYGGDIDAWSWTVLSSDGNEVANSTDQFPGFSINIPDTYTIVAELTSDECGSVTDTSSLFIQPNTLVVIDPFDNPYCQGSSPDTLSASPSEGTWSGSGIINNAEGIFDPSILIPGDYPVTYSIENGACSSMATQTIQVVASRAVTAIDTFFCITDGPGQLSVSSGPGEFSGTGISDINQGIFDPVQANIGSNTISYFYIDANECEIIIDFNVVVDTIPTINLNDTVFVCISNENINIADLANADANGEDGIFHYTGQGIMDTDSGIFNGASLNTGFYTIVVDFHARSCSAQDSFVIELAELPELILPEDETICVTDGTFTLTPNISGGEWSSANCFIDEDTGEIDLTSSGEADCVFQYTLSAGTSCEQSDVVNISIIDLSNDLQVPAPASICYTAGLYTIPGFSPANGSWSGEEIVDAVNGVVDVSVLEQGMSYTYTYCIESQEIDCEACKETILTIETIPEAAFDLSGSPCQGQSFGVLNNSINAVDFEWNFGDSIPPVNAFEPGHTYASAGDYLITLIAETAFGCKDTTTQMVHVTAPPSLILDISTEEGCAPLEIDYVNNSSGENITQYWIIDGVDTLFDAQPQIILDHVITDSLITLELVVYNDCETITQSKEILVHPYPMVDFGINDDEGCSPDTVFFMNTTLGLPENLLWNFGNGNTSTALSPPPQIFTSPDDSISTYTISLYASNICGEDLLSKEILVYPNNVDAFFEIDTLSGCPPLAVNIQNYATMGSTVSYDFGDGGTGNTPNTTYIYTEPGQYVITQYASLCGTDFFQSDTITVFPLANVNFDLPEFACIGESVQFTNLSTEGVVSQWYFGDGASSDEINPSHVFNTSGTYEVALIMNSIYNDCPDTLTKSILIPELPQAVFEAVPGEVCPNELILFQNQSTGAQNYDWNFGDNAGSEQESPEHSYTEPGIYEVTLTVFDEYGCSMDTTIINLLVHPDPVSNFELSSIEICQFYDTLFVTNTSTGYINSIWNLNGNFYADQQNDVSLVSEFFGVQAFELISINSFGCRDTSLAAFEVLPSPIAQSNFADTSGCQELTLDFIDISENSDLTKWVLDGNNTSTDSINTHTFIEYGNYTVDLVASNTNGCPSDTFSIEVGVFPRAIAGFEIVPFDSCGVPLEIEFINTSELSSDYLWNFGNGTTSSFFAPMAEYIDTGTYQISLISSNEFDCPDATMNSITIYPQTTADFTIPNTEICEGDTVIVLNTSTGANVYEWLLNDDVLEDFPLVITESGPYLLSLIASFNHNCFDTLTLQNFIEVYNAPYADFYAIIDESQNIIGDVRFENLSIDADEFLWNFGDGNTSNEEHPEHEYDIDGPVTVRLFSYNNNNGLFECIDETSQLINYERINTFYVPNAMSPDQNFGNKEVGVFKPKGIGIEEYELIIYSPWGDKIITLSQVLNGEPIDFWDGTFRGEPVPQGAYLWTANIKYQNGHSEFKKGNVTVLR